MFKENEGVTKISIIIIYILMLAWLVSFIGRQVQSLGNYIQKVRYAPIEQMLE